MEKQERVYYFFSYLLTSNSRYLVPTGNPFEASLLIVIDAVGYDMSFLKDGIRL